jgi:hypothetical protein
LHFGDHRDRSARDYLAAINFVDLSVRRAVFKRIANGVTQTLDAARDQRLDVALAVVAMLRQISQKIRIWPPRIEQLAR